MFCVIFDVIYIFLGTNKKLKNEENMIQSDKINNKAANRSSLIINISDGEEENETTDHDDYSEPNIKQVEIVIGKCFFNKIFFR